MHLLGILINETVPCSNEVPEEGLELDFTRALWRGGEGDVYGWS